MRIANYIKIIAITILLLGFIVFGLFWSMYQNSETVNREYRQAKISNNNYLHFVVLVQGWLTTQDLFFSGHQSYLANGIGEQSIQLNKSIVQLIADNSEPLINRDLNSLQKQILETTDIVLKLSKLSEPNKDLWLSNIEKSDRITTAMVITMKRIQFGYRQNELRLREKLEHTRQLFKVRTIILGLCYLAVIFVIGVWLVRSLVQPVQYLITVASNKSKPSTPDQFVLSNGPLEIVRLSKAIYQFMEQIYFEKQIAQRERLNTLNTSNRLSLIMNTVPLAIVLVDERGVIRDLNPETELLFSCKNNLIRGQKVFHFIPSMATVDGDFDEVFALKHHEQTLLSTELNSSYIEFTGKSLIIDEQNFYLLCISDIDQKKKNEKALLSLNKQLIHSEKMASIGQLAAGIAHEINNPIGFVNSNVSTLEEYLDNIKRYIDAAKNNKETPVLDEIYERENISYIFEDIPDLMTASKDGIDRVKNIVAGLGGYSHNESSEKTLSNIDDLIDQSLTLVRNELKNKADVKKQLDCKIEVLVYPQKLLQVFVNMLVNASHAMEEYGKIEISTYKDKEFIVIKIKDNGTGIADEYKSKLFEPFFTTKPVGSGTGLGLHIVHNIICEHNGNIRVESKLGVGTMFTIELPISH